MGYSTEYAAQIAVLVGFALKLFKIEIATEDLTTVISAALVLGGAIYAMYKRYQKGDISPLGVRK